MCLGGWAAKQMTLFVQSTHFTLRYEVNALHLYPEVTETKGMGECVMGIKEDREQEMVRDLENSDTRRMLRKIMLHKRPA